MHRHEADLLWLAGRGSVTLSHFSCWRLWLVVNEACDDRAVWCYGFAKEGGRLAEEKGRERSRVFFFELYPWTVENTLSWYQRVFKKLKSSGENGYRRWVCCLSAILVFSNKLETVSIELSHVYKALIKIPSGFPEQSSSQPQQSTDSWRRGWAPGRWQACDPSCCTGVTVTRDKPEGAAGRHVPHTQPEQAQALTKSWHI